MSDASTRVGITISADDQSKKGTESAAKGAAKLESKWASAGKKVGALPGQLGAASGAMMVFQGATSQMGGKVADATNKIAAVGALVAAGGPVGIALAALTLTVMAVSAAFEFFNKHSAEVEKSLEDMKTKADEFTKATEAAQRRLEDFGKTALQAEIDQIKASIAVKKASIAEDNKLIKAGKEYKTVMESRIEGETGVTFWTSKKVAIDKELVKETGFLMGKEMQRLDALEKIGAKEAAAAKADEHKIKRMERYKARLEEVTKLEESRAARQLSADQKVAAHAQRLANENHARRVKLGNDVAALEEKNSAERDARAKQEMLVQAALATTITNTWASAFEAMVTGQKSAGAAMATAMLETVETMIMAAAASAAAKQLEAHAFMPFVGIAIGAAAATAIFGMVKGFLGDLPAAAAGGLVTGGVAGRDSVPIMAMPGEVVTSAPEVDAMMRGGGGRPVTINLKTETLEIQNRNNVRRMMRDLDKVMVELDRRGMSHRRR